MLIVLGLGILWFSGVGLAILDGRRKRIGLVAVIALMIFATTNDITQIIRRVTPP